MHVHKIYSESVCLGYMFTRGFLQREKEYRNGYYILKTFNEEFVFLVTAFCTIRAHCVVSKYPVHCFFDSFRWWDITKNFLLQPCHHSLSLHSLCSYNLCNYKPHHIPFPFFCIVSYPVLQLQSLSRPSTLSVTAFHVVPTLCSHPS